MKSRESLGTAAAISEELLSVRSQHIYLPVALGSRTPKTSVEEKRAAEHGRVEGPLSQEQAIVDGSYDKPHKEQTRTAHREQFLCGGRHVQPKISEISHWLDAAPAVLRVVPDHFQLLA